MSLKQNGRSIGVAMLLHSFLGAKQDSYDIHYFKTFAGQTDDKIAELLRLVAKQNFYNIHYFKTFAGQSVDEIVELLKTADASQVPAISISFARSVTISLNPHIIS